MRDRLQLFYFLLAASPAVIWYGLSWFFDGLIPEDLPKFGPADLSDAGLSRTIRAAYVWGTSLAAVIIACVGATLYCGGIVARCAPPRLARVAMAGAVLLAVLLGLDTAFDRDGWQNSVSNAIFDGALAGVETIRFGKGGAIIDTVLAAVRPFGVFAIVFFSIACCSVLPEAAGQARTWQDLQRRTARLRGALFAGAVALVAVFFTLHSMFAFAEAALPRGPAAGANPEIADLRALADGLTIFWGAVLSLFLIVMFVPAAAVLEARARALARNANPDATLAELKTWMTERGLADRWSTRLANGIALFSPLLTGGLADLVRGVAGAAF